MGKIKDNLITFIFVLLIGVIFVVLLGYIGSNPDNEDCIIGQDSPDCLTGSEGHPLWNY